MTNPEMNIQSESVQHFSDLSTCEKHIFKQKIKNNRNFLTFHHILS